MYNTIDGNSILDAMHVDNDGIVLNAHDANLSCAARQELVTCDGGELVYTLVFGHEIWMSIN